MLHRLLAVLTLSLLWLPAIGVQHKAGTFAGSAAHWDSGQIKSIAHSNGVLDEYGQNSRLWPSRFTVKKSSTAYLDSSYTYDGAGNLIGLGSYRPAQAASFSRMAVKASAVTGGL